MEISHKTKFDIGDIVYFLDNGLVEAGIIYLVDVKKQTCLRMNSVETDVNVRYGLTYKGQDGFIGKKEDELFLTLEEIKEYILGLYSFRDKFLINPSIADLSAKDWFPKRLEEYKNKQSEQ